MFSSWLKIRRKISDILSKEKTPKTCFTKTCTSLKDEISSFKDSQCLWRHVTPFAETGRCDVKDAKDKPNIFLMVAKYLIPSFYTTVVKNFCPSML